VSVLVRAMGMVVPVSVLVRMVVLVLVLFVRHDVAVYPTRRARSSDGARVSSGSLSQGLRVRAHALTATLTLHSRRSG
jgi:hypothetical protein